MSVQAELLIASALAEGRKASIGENVSPLEERKSPASETAVSELLVNAIGDEKEDMITEPLSNNPSNERNVDIHSPAVSQAELIEEAKRLLVPVITQNARLRDPGADEETIKSRVMSLITVEHCVEFLQLAKDVREQMREKARHTPPAAVKTAEKGGAISRLSSAEAGTGNIQGSRDKASGTQKNRDSVAVAAVHPEHNVDLPSNPSAAISSIKSPPTAPRAMRIAQSIARSLPSPSAMVSPRKDEHTTPTKVSRSAQASLSGLSTDDLLDTFPSNVVSSRQSDTNSSASQSHPKIAQV